MSFVAGLCVGFLIGAVFGARAEERKHSEALTKSDLDPLRTQLDLLKREMRMREPSA